VCVGDFVQYKDERAYAVAVGHDPFDVEDRDRLRRAAKAQIRKLYRRPRTELRLGQAHENTWGKLPRSDALPTPKRTQVPP